MIGIPKINGSPILNKVAGNARIPSAFSRGDFENVITKANGNNPVQI